MRPIFLSHSNKDNKIVLTIQKHLYKNFIQSWIDRSDIPPGANIWESISSSIRKGRYFMPIISKNYCSSRPCMEELSNAYHRYVKGELKIIPIILIDEKEPDFESFAIDKTNLIKSITENIKYVAFDVYDESSGLRNVVDAVWAHESIKFSQIEIMEINSIKFQLIKFQTNVSKLPSDFLMDWGFNIEDFISEGDNDKKLIKPLLPVAFNGAAPNWLISFLTIPFKNQRTVFLFNNRTGDYICVYSLDKDKMIGQSLKVK
ncbi:MAG: toll/interleukin-1 receptor domain-containing protein [Deltaproteobacteria bacterium]|nr:toll/interleukin-1 receptor domain-containing protein [Deltaproteobacteria bacterium]MBW2165001.1 toll/interleukin-1 receptor domain-containing protein [Deltaproteobacteria bacterium]MBW2647947.1 toll/interleukin-1 receptor domain-containing protein [Deltaproteobacteria bacterium]